MSTLLTLSASMLALLQSDAECYTVEHLPSPPGERLEVGGLGFLPDGALVVSTRRGQVWIYRDPMAADLSRSMPQLFAEGLQEGLGLCVEGDSIYVLQRGELSRLHDDDLDGRCDRVQTLASDWGVSGNYHEFAFGLPRDEQGNWYMSLNVAFDEPWWMGASPVPYRGWVLRIDPKGSVHPFASGFRSPCGIGRDSSGRLLVTDNQGDWMAACGLFHAREGSFHGHPASLRWTEEFQRENRLPSGTLAPTQAREDAAIWLPYDWSRSTGDMASDTSDGKFGPFQGQLFLAEMTNGMILRAELEDLGGVTQGVVYPFRRGVGSAIRVRFAKDGSLFCGLTDRGWGGQAPGDGVARVRWNGRTPFEIQSTRLVPGGFAVTFTKPIDPSGLVPEKIRVHQYDYEYWWEYGSPLRNVAPRAVESIELSKDRRSAKVLVRSLTAGKVARMRFEGLQSAQGEALVHDELAYTVRRLADDPTVVPVAKPYSTPQPRESGGEGVLLLTQDEPLEIWDGQGWTRGGVTVDLEATGQLVRSAEEEVDRRPHEGRTLSNAGSPSPNHLTSRMEFGDIDLSFSFMLPKGSDSGLFLMGRYEVELRDHDGAPGGATSASSCGALAAAADGTFPARAPVFDAYRGPGEWHWLSVRFAAPRFDANGRKAANARILRVLIDDTLMQEEVELTGPTVGAPLVGEQARGPLVLQGEHGQIAIRDLTLRLREPRAQPGDAKQGWVSLFDGSTLAGWQAQSGSITGSNPWTVEAGVIVARGAGRLVSKRAEYRQFEFRGRCQLAGSGEGSLFLRSGAAPEQAPGFEVLLNHAGPGREKSGSLRGLARLGTQLIEPGVWFTLAVRCTEEDGGTRLVVRLNDVVVNEFLDPARSHSQGALVLQSLGAKTELRWKNLEIQEIP